MPACAIVPKFYGFYFPNYETQSHLSPILLIEDCGSPVDISTLHIDGRFVSRLRLQVFAEGIILLRTQLASMFVNLRHLDFLQGSVY